MCCCVLQCELQSVLQSVLQRLGTLQCTAHCEKERVDLHVAVCCRVFQCVLQSVLQSVLQWLETLQGTGHCEQGRVNQWYVCIHTSHELFIRESRTLFTCRWSL